MSHLFSPRRLSLLFALVLVSAALAADPTSKPAAESEQDKAVTAEADGHDGRPRSRRSDDEYYELYKSLADTLDQVERNYVQPIDRRVLMEAAIRGMLEKLDPYSGYIGPEEMSGFRTSVESQFGGIGIQITMDDGRLKVSSPLVGTPAYRAGVQAGDRILSIDDQPTREMPMDEAVRRLKGEVGTSVTITVQHATNRKIETFTLKRENIHVDTVMGDSRNPDDSWNFMLDADKRIGYIRITAFSRDTDADVRKALEALEKQKLRGLVLDLRFNPGGLLTAAVKVCDLFIDQGRIVSTKGRNTVERTWDAVKPGTFEGFPIAVLVNRYSASASEIVAACLQDHDRAVVIGERTWGKGSVQNVVELEEGKSALKLTTATYARPNGHNIHRFPDAKESDEWGVKPNEGMELRMSNPEMGAFLENRRRRDVVQVHQKSDPVAVATVDATDSNQEGWESGRQSDSKAPSVDQPEADDAAKSEPNSPVEEKGESGEGASEDPGTFIDRQLHKAIEYLTAGKTAAP